MSDVRIPADLVELQRRVDEAFDVMEAHRKQVGLPGAECPEEERQRSRELMADITDKAQELRDAITASDLEQQHGSAVFQPASKQAAREQRL